MLPVVGRKIQFGLIDEYDQEELEKHVPDQQLYPADGAGTVLSAAQYRKYKKSKVSSYQYYANPMQHLDYRLYETLMKTTFVGALCDSFLKYLVGRGIRPELELLEKSKDNEKDKEIIEKHRHIIEDLEKVDKFVSRSGSDGLDAGWNQKLTTLLGFTLFYNRSALIYDYTETFELNGTSYPQIPSQIIPAYPQDLGMVKVDDATRKLIGVQWDHYTEPWVQAKDMLYLWNPTTSYKANKSWHYGVSMLSPLMSANKIIRDLVNEILPGIAKNMYAGLFLLIYKNEGNTKQSKMEEAERIREGLTIGAPNILVKDPEDVAVHNVEYDPKIAELRELVESMVKLAISIFGLPHVAFYDEASANRATMVGKIQLTLKTTIEPVREWIGEAIATQWYQRWFEVLYKDKPELKKFKVKVAWSDLHISEWYDSVEAALQLDGRAQFTNEAFGDLLGMPDYETLLDKDAEVNPGGQQQQQGMGGPGMPGKGGGKKGGMAGEKLGMPQEKPGHEKL